MMVKTGAQLNLSTKSSNNFPLSSLKHNANAQPLSVLASLWNFMAVLYVVPRKLVWSSLHNLYLLQDTGIFQKVIFPQ